MRWTSTMSVSILLRMKKENVSWKKGVVSDADNKATCRKPVQKKGENPPKINQVQTKEKKRILEVVDDRDEVSEAETEQTAVDKKGKHVYKTKIGKAKLTSDDVAKAIGLLSNEEREAVLDAVIMHEDF